MSPLPRAEANGEWVEAAPSPKPSPASSSSVLCMTHPTPTIAIHGVGKHEPGKIEARIKATVGKRRDLDLSIAEFNWDQYVDHRNVRTARDAFKNLQRVSASFHATATIAVKVRREGLDTRLTVVQLVCCNVLRHSIAIITATVFAIPAVIIVVFLPTALLQIAPLWPTGEFRWFASAIAPVILCLIAALVVGIVALGCARALIGRSFAPIRSSISCTVLTLLAPLLVVLTTPLSVSWIAIGAIVGFLSFFGVVASLLEWLLPDTTVATVWRDFVIAPYLVGILVGLAVFQILRYFLGKRWHEGPLKILLDIARYVGEPSYRLRTLEQLAAFIREKQGNSENLIIVAHSLGTIIALDYLCNWSAGDRDRRISLITLGSPYRRFFLAWLPGVLFDRRMLNTVGRIRARHQSFRWLNVYRPWDYVGTSLKLMAGAAGTDRSTRQYRRLNGHADYWGDDTVLSTISGGLTSLPQSAAPSDIPSRAYIPTADDRSLSTGSSHSVRLLTGALACVSLGWMLYSFVGQQAELMKTRAAIDQRGVRAEVVVSQREIPDVADELATAHEFQFTGSGLEMPPYILSPLLPASVAQQRLDYRELEQFVRSNCVLEEHEPGRFDSDRFLLCKSKEPIEIVYLPPASNFAFYLPGFESRFHPSDIPEWFVYPLVVLAASLIPALPFIILALASYAVSLGRDPSETLVEITG